jgi:hypothetical protein
MASVKDRQNAVFSGLSMAADASTRHATPAFREAAPVFGPVQEGAQRHERC